MNGLILKEGFKVGGYQDKENKQLLKEYAKEIGVEVPKDYLEVVKDCSDIEIKVGDCQYIRIWGPEGCIEMNEAYSIQEFIPNSLAIGDDEGGKCLLYLEGYKGYGLYIVGFGALSVDEVIYLSPSLEDLLVRGVGLGVLLT